MSGQLGELVVALSADIARFRDDMGKAVKVGNDSSKRIADGFDKMGAGIVKVTGIVAGLAGVAGLGALAKSSIDAADNLSKLSQKVGVNIEQLSAMNYAAGLADVSTEALAKGMAKLNKAMYDANNGGKTQVETFKALGVSATDADGNLRKTDDVMMDIAERFAGMDDGARKTALAMEMFGKSGADMIPLLNAGKAGLKEAADEAKRFGLVLTEDAGKQAEEFNDNLTRLKAQASGLATTIANDLLPPINRLVDSFAKSAPPDGGIIKSYSRELGKLIDDINSNDFTEAFLRLGNLINPVSIGFGVNKTPNDQLKELEAQRQKLNGSIFTAPMPPRLKKEDTTPPKPGGKTNTGRSATGKSATVDPWYKMMDEQIGQLAGFEAARASSAAAIAKVGEDALKVEAEQAAAWYQMMEEQMGQLEGFAATRKDYDDKEIEAAKKKADELAKIDADAFAAKQAIQQKAFEAVSGSLENSMEGISSMLMQGNKDQFEAGKAIAETMIAIDTARAASAAFRGGAEIGGPWGVALGVAAAGAAIAYGAMNMARLDSIQYEARAMGGPVASGQTYLVGEKGPELFTPGASGQITSNDNLSSLGGANDVSVTNVYQISTGVSDTVRAEVSRMIPGIMQLSVNAVKSAMLQGQFQGVR